MGNSCGCCVSAPPEPPNLSSPHSPSLESAIQSIKESISKENPTHKIDLLIKVIDNTLLKIKAPSEDEASASSSGIQLESVAWGTRAASDIIDGISREANELKKSEIADELGRVALKAVKLVGESHWIFLGLSMAAYALERCATVRSNMSECIGLLEKIVDLAKDVKKLGETIPCDNDRLCKAVLVIVEGTILCREYSIHGNLLRFFLAAGIQTQLGKTDKTIQDIRSSLILSTVADIKSELPRSIEQSSRRLLDFKPEGIKEKVAQVKEMVDLEGSEAVEALVLRGLGGVGKSVLASAVIQELDCDSKGFKFCRVVVDEKTPDKTSHIIKLQKDIINDFGGGKLDLRNIEEGQQQVQQVVRNKSCLLLIDNVVDSYYIKELLPKHFEEISLPGEEKTGSVQVTEKARLRIVITSRQNNIKQVLNIKKVNDYYVDPLSETASKTILEKTILGEGQHESKLNADFDEEGCITDIAKACQGVPLLLSAFGNYLRVERDQTTYKEALKALTEGDFDRFVDEDLSEKLMFVYYKLKPEAKEALLDICAYFHGWRWELVADTVDSSNLEALHKARLVRKDDSGKVIVHDIFRLMGSKLAKETRVKNYNEFLTVVEDENKLKNIKGVRLTDGTCLTTIESIHFYAMRHSLRVVMLGDWVVVNGQISGAFSNLRYLQVGDVTVFPFTDASKMEKLTYFYNKSKPGMDLPELPRTLKALHYEVPYPGCEEFATLPIENLKTLKSFRLESTKPVKLPGRLKLPASLERLSLTGIRKLPETFSHLTNIEFLDLSKCHFESLPEGFEGLGKLKYLYMEYCPNLKHLSEGFGSLCSLIKLSVKGCTCFENLPDDFGKLTALENLLMGECESLRTLPEDFGGLFSLQYLDITGCISLERLPESFSRLSIKYLALESLLSLNELPQTIGNMPFLNRLRVKSCSSLTSLPNSFVQLRMLKYLTIDKCIKLTALPKDFDQLSSLMNITLKNCPLLKELPHGFQALPALKILTLKTCRNLVNLLAGFSELKCLEELCISGLPLLCLPKGFGNLKRLRCLDILNAFKLETMPDDIENLVSLRKLGLANCPMLDGATMEKIVKMQNCFYACIAGSNKLKERWEEMQSKENYTMAVQTKNYFFFEANRDHTDWQRAARVALFSLNVKELNATSDELMDRSSIYIDVDTTVAVILLPLHLQSHHEDPLKNMWELARERSRTGQLQIIICLKEIELDEQTASAEEEEETIRKALKWLPQGSCAIPVADNRRRLLVKHLFFPRYDLKESKLACFMANVRVQGNGHIVVTDGQIIRECDIQQKPKPIFQTSELKISSSPDPSDELQECLKILCNSSQGGGRSERSVQSPEVSMFKMLAQALKKKGIHHFIDCNMDKVNIDQLEGKDVCYIICGLNTMEHAKIQFYKDRQNFNYKGVWIPLSRSAKFGIGTYLRTCEQMYLTTLLSPMIIQGMEENDTLFVLLNKEGNIVSRASLSLLMSWGIKAYPFREFEAEKVISKSDENSTLEILLEDMDILDHKGDRVEKQVIKSGLILLHAEPPSHKLKMKCGFDQLQEVNNFCKVLYIGHFSSMEQIDLETYKKVYEDTTQKMYWLKLSFWDMLKFWNRCKYLSSNSAQKLNLSFTLPKLVKQLYVEKRWLVFLGSDGIITGSGKEVVDIICNSIEGKRDDIDIMVREELIKSKSESGKCTSIVQTYFSDEISYYPEHPQHLLAFTRRKGYIFCDVCYSTFKPVHLDHQRIYRCKDCEWDLCKDCWKLFAEKQVQRMLKL